jgi:hypothetical protein
LCGAAGIIWFFRWWTQKSTDFPMMLAADIGVIRVLVDIWERITAGESRAEPEGDDDG